MRNRIGEIRDFFFKMAAAAGLIASRQPLLRPALSLRLANTSFTGCHLPDVSLWICHYDIEMLMVDG